MARADPASTPPHAAAFAAAALLGAVLCAPAPLQAGSAEAGGQKIQSKGCITCHDADGRGTSPVYPHLAGQSEVYLKQQLEAFRSGQRQAPQMIIVAQNLSDADIADLAAYYAGLDPCAK